MKRFLWANRWKWLYFSTVYASWYVCDNYYTMFPDEAWEFVLLAWIALFLVVPIWLCKWLYVQVEWHGDADAARRWRNR